MVIGVGGACLHILFVYFFNLVEEESDICKTHPLPSEHVNHFRLQVSVCPLRGCSTGALPCLPLSSRSCPFVPIPCLSFSLSFSPLSASLGGMREGERPDKGSLGLDEEREREEGRTAEGGPTAERGEPTRQSERERPTSEGRRLCREILRDSSVSVCRCGRRLPQSQLLSYLYIGDIFAAFQILWRWRGVLKLLY